MGLDTKGYGIHGTNAPKSIGKAASHGCIRMAKRDLEELFSMVKAGDAVEIRGERDARSGPDLWFSAGYVQRGRSSTDLAQTTAGIGPAGGQ